LAVRDNAYRCVRDFRPREYYNFAREILSLLPVAEVVATSYSADWRRFNFCLSVVTR
jgi:hypothetical protein